MDDKDDKKEKKPTEKRSRTAGIQPPFPRLTPDQLRRLMEKPATKARRLEKDKERKKLARKKEIQEEGEIRRATDAIRQRAKREEEAPEEGAARRAADAIRQRAKREAETPEEKKAARTGTPS